MRRIFVGPGELVTIRKRLKKTQKQMAELLGVSIKAVHSYEQGWRMVPAHVERQAFFLLSRSRGTVKNSKACWAVKKCPPDLKEKCPAWEFRSGTLCWFINGTICAGTAHGDWKKKMKVCRECKVLAPLLSELEK
jgi:DNA-binding XRE family transcriptional regulator